MKYVVVGDIHGAATQLETLIKHEWLFEDRQAVFLGDYVDVGPDSRSVLEILICFRAHHRDAVFLRGNHDVAMLEYLERGDFPAFASQGGITTIRSYRSKVYGDVHASFYESVPDSHRTFLNELELCVENERVLMSHSGYAPENPLDRSVKAMLGTHISMFLGNLPLPKLAICGHYYQPNFQPYVGQRLLCLDTGCSVLNGPLTAAMLPEMEFVQVWPSLNMTRSRRTSNDVSPRTL